MLAWCHYCLDKVLADHPIKSIHLTKLTTALKLTCTGGRHRMLISSEILKCTLLAILMKTQYTTKT